MNIEIYKEAHLLQSRISQLERLTEEINSGYRFELVKEYIIPIIEQKLLEFKKEFDEL